MLLDLLLTQRLIILGTLSKFSLTRKELNLLTYPVYLKVNLYCLLNLLILKIRNRLLCVINTIKPIHRTVLNYNT